MGRGDRMAVLLCAAALLAAGCDGGGGSGNDDGPPPDAVTDVLPQDPGPQDPGPGDPGTTDPGPTDPGAPPADTPPSDVPPDPAPPDAPADPGAGDPGTADPGTPPDDTPADPGATDLPGDPGTDVPAGEWPPSEPWWGTKACNLPACDPGAPAGIDLSGLWTQTLTALRHDCNSAVELLKPEIKAGTVTTNQDQSFTVQGTCAYDGPGGTVTGVLKGDTMINCLLRPPEQGVTAMPSGWITFDGATGAGKSTVRLYGIPVLKPTDCSIEYDVAYVRQ